MVPITSDVVPTPPLAYAPAVKRGPFLFLAGQTATDWKDGVAPEARLPHLGNSAKVEFAYIYRNLLHLLEAAGLRANDVVRIDTFYTRGELQEGHFAARDEVWGRDPARKFASTAVEVTRFLPRGARTMMDAIALDASVEKRRLSVDRMRASPAAIPMALIAGDYVFLSGRMAYGDQASLGLAPEAQTATTFWPGHPSPAKAQTRFLLNKLMQILDEAGSSLAHVVKAQVYLLRPDDVTFVEEVWQEFFPSQRPARSFVIANAMAITGGVVEINLIATVAQASLERRTVQSDEVPPQPFNDPHAVGVGPLLFLSGQMATDQTGLAAEVMVNPEFPYNVGPGRSQMGVVLRNTAAICRADGFSLKDVAKVQTYFTDLSHFDAAHEVWRRSFGDQAPAWSILEVEGPLPVRDAVLYSDVIACQP